VIAAKSRVCKHFQAARDRMLVVIGVLSILTGALLAGTSRRFPAYVRVLEIGAGFLLICGLALSSCALPVVL
jgi:hypothetical protein